jgi:mono/diheme cytochrome c family protein
MSLVRAFSGGLAILAACIAGVGTVVADGGQGEVVYQTHCASCHGSDGRPDPDSVLVDALGVIPANFSDALFNSREPVSDWKIVVTHGGGALGFSSQMPAFGEALSEAEIDAVLDYIKRNLGGKHGYPDGELNLFLPIRTKKAFPEDEWVWKQRFSNQDGDDSWKNVLEYEFRIGELSQGIIEITHEMKGGQSNFGHFEPGFKRVLHHDMQSGSILTGAVQLGVPLSGRANWELLPYLAFGKIFSDQMTIQGSARLKLDLDDADKNSAELAAIIHWTHTPWPRKVFPAIEVVAEVPFERGASSNRQDAVQWSLMPQARIGLNKRGNIALNAGIEWPLNSTERFDRRVYLYFIWDFADGGLFEGW